MILCYDIGDAVDACGLTRGTKPLHIQANTCMTPHLEHVTCGVCLAAIEGQLI